MGDVIDSTLMHINKRERTRNAKGTHQRGLSLLKPTQISLPLSIYNIFTGSNQTPFIGLQDLQGQIDLPLVDLQGFYRVEPVSFLLFTRFLQGQNSLPLSIYKNFAGSNQSPFFDLQGFYRVKISLTFSISKVFRGPNQCLDLHDVYTLFTCF